MFVILSPSLDHDFLDHYLDRRDYELIQMDTDSMYFALSYDTLEEAVKPELLKEFERKKKQWLSWDKWSSREPGLFKLESEGTRAIALCSKCNFVARQRCLPRACQKPRTSFYGGDMRWHWKGIRSWLQTEGSG